MRGVTVKFSLEPAIAGAGGFCTGVALFQLVLSLILKVAKRISYWEAVPLSLSSPGAVQVRVMELGVGLPAARSLILAGGELSVCASAGIGINPKRKTAAIKKRNR